MLASLLEEQQRLEDTAAAIARSRLPRLEGGGTFDWTSETILQPRTIGSGFVGFAWDLGTNDRRAAQQAEARIQAERNRLAIERELRELESAVRDTRDAAAERLDALDTARAAVGQAEENLRIRRQQFDAGRATSEDVLDAQALLTRQRATLAIALYQAHTRRAELQELMGLPLEVARRRHEVDPWPDASPSSSSRSPRSPRRVWWSRRDRGPLHYTGFVEGEERVLRSEVSGRVLEVLVREGDQVAPGALIARLDDRDIAAQVRLEACRDRRDRRPDPAPGRADRAHREHLATRPERAAGGGAPGRGRRIPGGAHVRPRAGAGPDGRQHRAAARRSARVARPDPERASTGRASCWPAPGPRSGPSRWPASSARCCRQQRAQAAAQLAELEVTAAKFHILAPQVPTVVQTQLIWPGELAQAGTPIVSVLDPTDKYVQVYVPVTDTARVRVGTRVEIELDSEPGHRVPGEVTFVADAASFTPEKIETRSDRLGQVFRAKVRILEGVERFQPGAEGNVYLVDEGDAA